jgi:hypothetical protein
MFHRTVSILLLLQYGKPLQQEANLLLLLLQRCLF